MPSLTNMGNEKLCISTAGGEDTCEENVLFTPTPKRKWPSNIVTSDSEDDDNVPISKLKRMRLLESPVRDTATPRRRRLVKKSERKDGFETISSSKNVETTKEDFEDDESEEDGSDSESDGLKDFIVESDATDSDDASSKSSSDTVDDADSSDDDVTFGEILSRLKRSKDHKMKWEFEADMLAAFGKDHEICMKAVCALYRQQTSDEKDSKETFHNNGRGFSKFDAYRGSTLARFLTDGETLGDLKRSVDELREHDSYGVRDCRKLAARYSKQLFWIYLNKEDHFFLPLNQQPTSD